MFDDRKRDRDKGRSRSWKEIDAIRDKSHARDRDPMQKQSSPAAMNAQKSYRAALERAFTNGTIEEFAKTLQGPPRESRPPTTAPAPSNGTPAALPTSAEPAAEPVPAAPAIETPRDPDRDNRMKMLVRIREAEGREPITKAIDAFLAKYPKLPDDFEVLAKLLSHKSDDRIADGLARIGDLLGREKPRRGRTLVAHLRILEDTHSDPEIRRQASQVRAKL